MRADADITEGAEGKPRAFFRKGTPMRRIMSLLTGAVFLLTITGLIAVASASDDGTTKEMVLRNNKAFMQGIWLAIGLAACCVCWKFDYRFFKRGYAAVFLLAATLAALILVLAIGIEVKGSQRWLNLYFMRVQPSELAKISMVIVTCAWLDRIGWHVQKFTKGILIPGVFIAAAAGLILKEPDLGAAAVLMLTCGVVLFAAGAKLIHLIPSGLLVAMAGALLLLRENYRRVRFQSFMKAKFNVEIGGSSLVPESALSDQVQDSARYHVEQSLTAIGNGGWFGRGFMNSVQKKSFLPEAHTDFIYAIIGEEFGFIGAFLVIVAFTVIMICGLFIAKHAADRFGRLLAFGMTFLIAFQACFNLCVVTDMLPTKGIALPFLSYGGTSLLASMVALGIILSVGRVATEMEETQSLNAGRDHL